MRRFIVTFSGAGLSPYAPGTAATLVAVLALYAAYTLLKTTGNPPDRLVWETALLCGMVGFSLLAVIFGPWATAHYGGKDPSPFVIDEVAGTCLTWLYLPMYPDTRQAGVAACVFLSFRLFDILKPPPARQLERLPQGWGILLDDLAAAVYANLLCQVILRWVVAWATSP